MLKQRIATAIVLLIFVLSALLTKNPIYWSLLVNLAIAISFWEWLRFCQVSKPINIAFAYALFFTALYVLQTGMVPLPITVLSVCVLWLVLFVFTATGKLQIIHRPRLKVLIGIAIISMAGLIVIRLQQLTHGVLWILCLFVCVWAADIGAYFVGKRFGKTKLAPVISPGKTVEGLAGGIALAMLIYTPILFYYFPANHAALLLLTVLVTVLVSVMGDLFESTMKRHVGLKDSSHILPGHGGILDRIDSLLSAAPFFAAGLILLKILS